MREEDIEVSIKVIVIGNGTVGKSCMIQRYCKGYFTKEYKKTIGVDFLERMINVQNEDVRLMLWDTAGQEEFDSLTQQYYRGAQACVLAFSTVDYNSFTAIPKWKEKVEKECGSIPMVLVQNKVDLIDASTVRQEEAEEMAKKLRLRLYRTSVKEDVNVNEVFNFIAGRYVTNMNKEEEENRNRVSMNQVSNGSMKGSRKSNRSDETRITLDPKHKKKKKFCF